MSAARTDRQVVVVIASWLEPELVSRIGSIDPMIEVRYEPDLLPTPRYIADHHGTPRQLTADQLHRWRDHLADAEVLFDFDWLDPAELPHAAPKLRWIQGTSAGIGEFLSSTDLVSSSITFTTAAGVHAVPLAEFTILGLLYFAKHVPTLRRWQSHHHWQVFATTELAGSRVLVIGLGRVGGEIARRCAAMGMEVWGTRRAANGRVPEGVTRMIPLENLDAALTNLDALVLSCPLTPQTAGLIRRAQLDALPTSAVLVNVSRGPVVDEEALIEALQAGKLRGAALDVFAREPLPADSALWDLPNVLVSPHSASTVPAENERIVEIFVENLRRYLRGQPLINEFERTRGY